MKIDKLKKLLHKFDANVVYNADLKKKNWFNIGGKAKLFFKANELKDLVEFLKILDNKESINIGIPKNVGINEVIELLPLATETIMPHVIKKTLKTIEKLIAFKPKN